MLTQPNQLSALWADAAPPAHLRPVSSVPQAPSRPVLSRKQRLVRPWSKNSTLLHSQPIGLACPMISAASATSTAASNFSQQQCQHQHQQVVRSTHGTRPLLASAASASVRHAAAPGLRHCRCGGCSTGSNVHGSSGSGVLTALSALHGSSGAYRGQASVSASATGSNHAHTGSSALGHCSTNELGVLPGLPHVMTSGRFNSRRRSRRSLHVTAGGATAATAAPGGASPHAVPLQNDLELPKHWSDQMQSLPVGKRRMLEQYYAEVAQIKAFEKTLRQLSNEQLAAKTGEFKARLAAGATLNDVRAEAFAVVREASSRTLGMRHYDCQLVGGLVLHDGQIAEMQTGEGKTLVATLPVYLNALMGLGVHVVTVNDYLAGRDADWMGKLYKFLGLTCAAVQSDMSTHQLQHAFGCDITYVTGQELCFTYLRDNTCLYQADLALPECLHYAVIDEVDSILIDESRNPMIISAPAIQPKEYVVRVNKAVRWLYAEIQAKVDKKYAHRNSQSWTEEEKRVKATYFKLDEKTRSISLTEVGTARMLALLVDVYREEGVPFPSFSTDEGRAQVMDLWEGPVPFGRLTVTALQAHEAYILGKDYLVQDGKVCIINQATGRLLVKTRWQNGLHQAVEAKENVNIKDETHVAASISFQLFFKEYDKLAGMTGTAQAAAAELYELYQLRVVAVPTNQPRNRTDHTPRIYFEHNARLKVVADLVLRNAWVQRRPILIGTTSVQESSLVLEHLEAFRQTWLKRGVALPAINLLNATPGLVKTEAQIIAQAGLPGAVTIATNMAGRGTDIILGGNPSGLTRVALMRLVLRRLASAKDQAAIPQVPLGVFDIYDTCTDCVSADEYFSQSPELQLPETLHAALNEAMLFAQPSPPPPEPSPSNGPGEGSSAVADFQAGLGNGEVQALFKKAAEERRQYNQRMGAQLANGSGGIGNSSDDPLRSGASSSLAKGDLTYEEMSGIVAWGMEQAEELRRELYRGLRAAHPTTPEKQLDYATIVTPAALRLWDTQSTQQRVAGEPLGRKKLLRLALLLWLWFDNHCAKLSKEVKAVGGLMVIGTSVNESRRIEQQLRGRAGRQGDPGETHMVYDIGDPVIAVFGMAELTRISHTMVGLDNRTAEQIFLDGPIVEQLVSYIINLLESQYKTSRLEMKKYDEILESYRNNLYTLRRLILTGSPEQRMQIALVLMQRKVDEEVGKYLDPNTSSEQWLTESMTPEFNRPGQPLRGMQEEEKISPLDALLQRLDRFVNPADATTVEFEGLTMEARAMMAALGQKEYRLQLSAVNLLTADMFREIRAYVDPRGKHTTFTQRQQQDVSQGHKFPPGSMMSSARGALTGAANTHAPAAADVSTGKSGGRGGAAVDAPALELRASMLAADLAAKLQQQQQEQQQQLQLAVSLTGSQQHGQQQPLREGFSLNPMELFTRLGRWLSGSKRSNPSNPGRNLHTLVLPEPQANELKSLKNRLLLETHRSLFGFGGTAAGKAGSSSSGSSAGGGSSGGQPRVKRPDLRGKSAAKVGVLRDCLGEAVARAYLMRRLSMRRMAMLNGLQPISEEEAEVAVQWYEQATMLQWMDAFWACFLEDVEAIRKGSALKAYSNSTPLAEFRIEANATFLALLDNYRDAVVNKLLQPHMTQLTSTDITFSAPAAAAEIALAAIPATATPGAGATANAREGSGAAAAATVQAQQDTLGGPSTTLTENNASAATAATAAASNGAGIQPADGVLRANGIHLKPPVVQPDLITAPANGAGFRSNGGSVSLGGSRSSFGTVSTGDSISLGSSKRSSTDNGSAAVNDSISPGLNGYSTSASGTRSTMDRGMPQPALVATAAAATVAAATAARTPASVVQRAAGGQSNTFVPAVEEEEEEALSSSSSWLQDSEQAAGVTDSAVVQTDWATEPDEDSFDPHFFDDVAVDGSQIF